MLRCAHFAADVDWAQQNGIEIERFNLARQPLAFAENSAVKAFLEGVGKEGLPLILVDSAVLLSGRYPSRTELACWAGITEQSGSSKPASGCCSDGRCC